MMTRTDLQEKLRLAYEDAGQPSPGAWSDWYNRVSITYAEVLRGLGLTGYWLLTFHAGDDEEIDGLQVGTPTGDCLDIPDPTCEEDEGFPDLADVVDFFLGLPRVVVQGVTEPLRVTIRPYEEKTGRPRRLLQWVNLDVDTAAVTYRFEANAVSLATGKLDDEHYQPLCSGHDVIVAGETYKSPQRGPDAPRLAAIAACRPLTARLQASGVTFDAGRLYWPAGLPTFVALVAEITS